MNDDAKEEIKERLPVEEVVGQYIELKRAGKNLKGRSPWGVDRNPSFMVSPERGTWHDFSANKGGDIFTFIMEVEGIGFREALEKLAAQAGVELKQYSGSDKAMAQKKARAREALELATKFYQVCLSKNKSVCEYVFYKRNLNKGTVQDFRIGYAPKAGKALRNFLVKRGFSTQELEAAGLLNRFGGDLFRGRMMVPFIDRDGKVIGFTARVLDDSEPKYLNTPETILFNKSRFIFGLYNAAPAIRREEFVVIAEGNMDVISSHQAGVANTVATSGTAMTERQLKILAGLTEDVRLAYDGDEAGVKATERAINIAGGMGVNLSVISDYHGAKDPDELIQKDAKLWKKAVQERVPAVDWLLSKYEEKLDLSSARGKREYSDVALRVIGYLKDPIERKHYEQKVAGKLGVGVEDLREKKIVGASSGGFGGGSEGFRKRRRLKEVRGGNDASEGLLRNIEDSLLAIMVYGGEAGGAVGKETARMGSEFALELPEEESRIEELGMVFEERYAEWDFAQLEREVRELAKRREEELKKRKVAELSKRIEETEDEEERERLMREIVGVRKG